MTAHCSTSRQNAPIRLPVAHWVRIVHLDGREWCRTSFLCTADIWGWVQESVAHEQGVREDEVGCLDDLEGGGDLVTVAGEAVYRVVHGLAGQGARRELVSIAAE